MYIRYKYRRIVKCAVNNELVVYINVLDVKETVNNLLSIIV